MNKKKIIIYALIFAFFVLSICIVFLYNKTFKVSNIDLVYYSENNESIVFLFNTENMISSNTSILFANVDPVILKSKMDVDYIEIPKEDILLEKNKLDLGDVVNVEVKGDLFRKQPEILNTYKYKILNKKENLIDLSTIDGYILDIYENSILVAKTKDLEIVEYLNNLSDKQLKDAIENLTFEKSVDLGYFNFENSDLIKDLTIRQAVKIRTKGVERESYPTQAEAVEIYTE